MSDVHEGNYEDVRDRILASVGNAESRDLFEQFLAREEAKGKAYSSLGHVANVLRGLAEVLGTRSVKDATYDDILRYANRKTRTRIWRTRRADGTEVVKRQEVQLSRSTKAVHNVWVKAFYAWLRDCPPRTYPPEVAWLSTNYATKDAIPVDHLLRRPHMKKLLQAHTDPQDKAILAVLFEGGFRASELCALNVSSITFDDKGAIVMLPKNGKNLKTGTRRVRLFDAVSFLLAWYELHPRKHEPGAPLFFSRSYRAYGARYRANSLYAFGIRAGKKAEIPFSTNPHLFRHSSATEKARLGWNEHQMRAFYGWSRTSNMPSQYVHLAGGDYENMELARRGLIDQETTRPALAPEVCPVCQYENALTASFCQSCRTPLGADKETQFVDQMDAATKLRLFNILAKQVGMESDPPASAPS